MRLALLLALLGLPCLSPAQTNAAAPSTPAKPATELQKTVDQLTQSNRDLLDLLKKQQSVLEDIQYDRRLQSRQIESLEERLADALLENTRLQNKVGNLESAAAARPATAPVATAPAPSTQPTATNAPPTVSADVPPPATYLPAPEPNNGPPETLTWHRLLTLKGDAGRQTDLFPVQGKTWRVLWHNQDKPGKAYANTSALFINAFPKDDTIPQKVCAKLGTGGDATELQGPGNYYLKIEASGGSWELAVEDFRSGN
jgi:hypothetical protein